MNDHLLNYECARCHETYTMAARMEAGDRCPICKSRSKVPARVWDPSMVGTPPATAETVAINRNWLRGLSARLERICLVMDYLDDPDHYLNERTDLEELVGEIDQCLRDSHA